MKWLDQWSVFFLELLDQAALRSRVLAAQYLSDRVFLPAQPADPEPEEEEQLEAEIAALEYEVDELTTQILESHGSLDDLD